jgi:hypothetical protein
MTIKLKKPQATAGRKQSASMAGRILGHPKKAAVGSVEHGVGESIERTELRKVDQMLRRIERKGKALSLDADRLLRRVS